MKSNTTALLALLAGGLSAVGFLVPVIGPLLGIAGIVLGGVALKRQQNRVMAIIGIIAGAAGLLAGLFITIAWFGLGAAFGDA